MFKVALRLNPPEDCVLRNDLLSPMTATTPRGGERLPSACFDKRESTGGNIGDRRYMLSLVRIQRETVHVPESRSVNTARLEEADGRLVLSHPDAQ